MTSTHTPSKIFEFMSLIGQLKSTKRTGWVERGVPDSESVADHMYRMAILAFLVEPQSNLNKDRCIKLSLVHDMAECIVGDLAPSDGVSKDEKHSREKAAMEQIQSLVSKETGEELYSLWEEYEFEASEEARFVKDLDKFDMVMQAYEYEKQDKKPGFLQDFFNSTKGKFQTDQVKGWVQELNTVRGSQAPRQTVIQKSPVDGATREAAVSCRTTATIPDSCTANGSGSGQTDSETVHKRRKLNSSQNDDDNCV